ncbi:Egg protein, partial [Schistosoma japonicum]
FLVGCVVKVNKLKKLNEFRLKTLVYGGSQSGNYIIQTYFNYDTFHLFNLIVNSIETISYLFTGLHIRFHSFECGTVTDEELIYNKSIPVPNPLISTLLTLIPSF